MALIAGIDSEGKLVTQPNASKNSKTDSTNPYTQDMFLKLLIAEVQNQDPLEPSSNTEWVSQYATFSELEQMENMSGSYELNRASEMVGKMVMIKTTDSSGDVNYVQGKVDYVTYENGKAYVSVNGNSYSISDVYSVADSDYLSAYDKAYAWTVDLNKLPSLSNLTLGDKSKVEKLSSELASMNDYEKSFITQENIDKISAYEDRIDELQKIKEAAELAEKEAAEKAEKEEAEKTAAKKDTETVSSDKADEEKAAETGLVDVTEDQLDALLSDPEEKTENTAAVVGNTTESTESNNNNSTSDGTKSTESSGNTSSVSSAESSDNSSDHSSESSKEGVDETAE